MADACKVAAALLVINHNKKKEKNGQKRKPRWWIREFYRGRESHTKLLLSVMTFEGVEKTIILPEWTLKPLKICVQSLSQYLEKRYDFSQRNHNKRETGFYTKVFSD